MNEGEYRAALVQAWLLAKQIRTLPLLEMLRAISHTDALAPILDPTAYIQKSGAMHEDERLLDALLGVKTLLDQMEADRAPKP